MDALINLHNSDATGQALLPRSDAAPFAAAKFSSICHVRADQCLLAQFSRGLLNIHAGLYVQVDAEHSNNRLQHPG